MELGVCFWIFHVKLLNFISEVQDTIVRIFREYPECPVYVTSFDKICKSFADVFRFYILLFELLVSSLSCVAIYSLKSAFTFPQFQISSLIDKCSLLMVFEALFKCFCSSKFGGNIKLFKAVVLNGLSDTQQSINLVSSSTNSLPAQFGRRRKMFFFQKTICSYASFIVHSCPSDETLLILFVLFLVAPVTMVLGSETSFSNLFLSSRKLFSQQL